MLHRKPTELDFAFFIDRATHGGTPAEKGLDDLANSVRSFIASMGGTVSPARLRWELARQLPVANVDQQETRHARDVIFVIDDPTITLGAKDLLEWVKDGKSLYGTSFGLSDTREMLPFTAGPSAHFDDRPVFDNATVQETAACPAVVLNPKSPKRDTASSQPASP